MVLNHWDLRFEVIAICVKPKRFIGIRFRNHWQIHLSVLKNSFPHGCSWHLASHNLPPLSAWNQRFYVLEEHTLSHTHTHSLIHTHTHTHTHSHTRFSAQSESTCSFQPSYCYHWRTEQLQMLEIIRKSKSPSRLPLSSDWSHANIMINMSFYILLYIYIAMLYKDIFRIQKNIQGIFFSMVKCQVMKVKGHSQQWRWIQVTVLLNSEFQIQIATDKDELTYSPWPRVCPKSTCMTLSPSKMPASIEFSVKLLVCLSAWPWLSCWPSTAPWPLCN